MASFQSEIANLRLHDHRHLAGHLPNGTTFYEDLVPDNMWLTHLQHPSLRCFGVGNPILPETGLGVGQFPGGERVNSCVNTSWQRCRIHFIRNILATVLGDSHGSAVHRGVPPEPSGDLPQTKMRTSLDTIKRHQWDRRPYSYPTLFSTPYFLSHPRSSSSLIFLPTRSFRSLCLDKSQIVSRI